MSEKVRRLSTLFLALALAVGLMTHGIQTSDMAVKMATAATSDMPMPGGCSGCIGDDDGMLAACFALCSGVAAVLPSVPAVDAAVLVSPPATRAVAEASHHGPPDPYPPRPIILG